ncbi:MAG: chitobiase/beta-hexosaminidase C-terminal domain-containing protein, partial [Acidimicrobiales bacterium]
MAGGLYHTLLATPAGALWAWGDNNYGALGNGTTTDRYVPGLVSSLSDIKAVAASYGLSLALEDDGDLWSWGLNNNGQIGDGTITNRTTPYKVLTGVAAMAAGEIHVVAVKTNGTVWVFGDNTKGQLGQGSTSTTDQKTPIQVPGLSGVAKVAAGQYFSVALKTDGTLVAFGYNAYGQLGQGDTTLRASPTAIAGLTGIQAIAAGQNHALALRSDGQVFAWGQNNNCQIGDGTSSSSRLTPVQLLECPPVVSITAGQSHSLAHAETGVVYAWGRQIEGQVGDGTTGSYQVNPVALDAPDDIGALGAGYRHSIAISRDGSVWGWGHNFQGQVGDGTATNRLAPVRVADAGFAWLVGAPIFSPTPAWSSTPVAVTMTSHTPGAEIRYTTDGSEPSGTSTVYTAPVTPAVSTDLRAKAFKSGQSSSSTTSWYYEYRAVTPGITPGTATYTSPQTVTMSTTTSGATIRYTTDLADPTETSTAYTGPFSVGTKTTIRAVTFKAGWTPSTINSRTYSFNYGTATAPTVNPATGTYTDSVTVTMSAQAGA